MRTAIMLVVYIVLLTPFVLGAILGCAVGYAAGRRSKDKTRELLDAMAKLGSFSIGRAHFVRGADWPEYVGSGTARPESIPAWLHNVAPGPNFRVEYTDKGKGN